MLKKSLVVVVALLVTASLANAATVALTDFSLSYVGNVFTVTGNVAKEINFGIYDDSGNSVTGDWTAGTIFPAAGGLGAMLNSGFAGLDFQTQNKVSQGEGDPTILVTTGDWFTFTFTGNAKTFNVYDYAVSATSPIGSVTATSVPEPATMLILGLGGLLLRRKK